MTLFLSAATERRRQGEVRVQSGERVMLKLKGSMFAISKFGYYQLICIFKIVSGFNGICDFSGRRHSRRQRCVCGDFVNLEGFAGTVFEDAPRGRVCVYS
jgi:hypothetical protein